jgi:hypothetical protein
MHVYERSVQIHLIAYRRDPVIDNSGFEVASFAFPKLPENTRYLTVDLECSPVSLSGKGKDLLSNHLLEDGEGIFAINLHTQSATSVSEGAPEHEVDTVSETATAVGMIQPFHLAAMRALSDEGSMGRAPGEPKSNASQFGDWAYISLSWLPRHVQSPTRNAMCGYRLIVAAETSSGNDGFNKAQVGLTIYDFTPAHVQRAIVLSRGLPRMASLPSQLANCSGIRLGDAGPTEMDDPAIRYLVKDSFPSFVTPQLENSLVSWATESPYLMASRTITLGSPGGPAVLHFTHEYLCFVQVSNIDRCAGLRLMSCTA